MENYKDKEKYLTLLNSKEWRQTISDLKSLECDNANKNYFVMYRKDNHRKDRTFQFNSIKFVDETNSFVFTRYQQSDIDGALTKDVSSIETIKSIDIISYEARDKFKWSDYFFIC